MGAFGGAGNLFRSIGSVGNEVMSAQTGLQDLNQKLVETKVKNLMDQLKIQQTQQQIKKGETDPLEQQAAAAEKVLGRKLTPDERKVLLGLAPVPPTQTIDKASLRSELLNLANDDKATPVERRVYGSLLQDIDAGGDLKEIMGKKQAFQSSRAEVSPGEDKPVTEVFNNQRWQFDPGKKISGKRDATGQYVLLGTAKEDTGGVGSSSFDSSIQAAADGRINPPSPSSKNGAAWWARAKVLGLDDQIKTRTFGKDKNAQDLVKLEAEFNALKQVPPNPTPQQSQALATLADKVLGGSAKRQDLIDRGRRSALMGLRSPYASASYPKDEYADLVNIIQSVFNQRNGDLSDLGAVPVAQ
jgi:hypothetical protein